MISTHYGSKSTYTMIQTLPLFLELDQHLIALLGSLSPEEWEKPTLAGHWKVKDVAYHLLDGNIRGISQSRDKHFPTIPDGTYKSITHFINDQNQLWVSVAQRISFPLLIQLMKTSSHTYYEHLSKLDLMAKALFPVSWAGEKESLNWFHIAREYTEKWHHQQQILQAVGRPSPIMEERFYLPFLDTCMYALPHHYQSVEAEEGTSIQFSISPLTAAWTLIREANKWVLSKEEKRVNTSVNIPDDIAWRIFTRGISQEEAEQDVAILGDQKLGRHILSMLTFMI
ncbi:MAG: hypothetical protein AAGC85_05675 [Bacteroidota bacterium]